jgi:fermentation-respiration switch protein FrsA (DUF1100 family)
VARWLRLPKSRWKRYCITLPLILGGTSALVVVAAAIFEDDLVYRPFPPRLSWHAPPPDWHAEERELHTADGIPIHAWWVPSDSAEAGVALFCHGNGGNDSHAFGWARVLRRELGVSVLAFDYPGYGKSGGRVSEAGCHAAGESAYRWLVEEKKVPPGRILLVGESLGGGVAVPLATRHDHRALVLIWTFSTLPDTAAELYPFLPCHLVMRNRFDNLTAAPHVRRPVFQLHGTADGVIPIRFGERLHAALPEPKEFLTIPGLGHGGELPADLGERLRRFLEQHAP